MRGGGGAKTKKEKKKNTPPPARAPPPSSKNSTQKKTSTPTNKTNQNDSVPYLEVLRHLAARGYRVIAQVDTRNEPWVRRAYEPGGIEVELIPPELTAALWADFETRVDDVAENGDRPWELAAVMGSMGTDFSRALYAWTKKRAQELQASLFVIDVFYGHAADACDELGIPYVATTSGLTPGMADAPWVRPLYTERGEATTLNMSLLQRLKAATVDQARTVAAALPAVRDAAAARKELGVTAPKAALGLPADRFRGRVTLVNTFFDHMTPRPLPPWVRLIGPVRSCGAATGASELEGEFRAFVDRHGGAKARLVVLSFGQNCVLSPARLRALLGGIRRLLDRGVIDGAIWSTSLTSEGHFAEAGFREPGALPGEDRLLLRPWIPQKLLLAHPAVRVFVSHGGTESCGEAFWSATPTVNVPHFSDQPCNSVGIQEAGAGLVLYKRELSPERVEAAIARVVSDPSFAAAARRMRALAVSRGRLATEAAADELEYVLHHGDGHLQQADGRMPWVKRTNLDLYLAMAAVAGAAGVAGAALVVGAARRRCG